MRIITGKYKGKQLRAVAGDETRPTMDRVREALFSILSGNIEDALVLDLFAGSGALGIEALSRGAARAHFIEKSRQVVEVLNSNIAMLPGADCAVHHGPVERVLPGLAKKGLVFDLIFLDPPYGRGLVARTLETLCRLGLLARECRVIAEHETRFKPPREIDTLFRIDRRKYGDTTISIYSPFISAEK